MSSLGEFDVIDRYFRRPAPGALLGVGDDAALIAPRAGWELALSVDMLVAGRHFFADVPPRLLGHKTLAVNLSDMAAMGATPRWALLAGALPAVDEAWLEAFCAGFFALAERHGVDLVGGDTTRGPLTLCVTIAGEVPAGMALRRSGARAGDAIWVSGELGGAALALAHRLGRIGGDAAMAACEARLLAPTPRVELGVALRGVATSAIDVSDGLVGDLGHVARASGLGARLELASIPRPAALDTRLRGAERAAALECLLAGGDDYELCFTAPPSQSRQVVALAAATGVAATCIGRMETEPGLRVLDESGRTLAALPRGFDHFEAAA